ncbi:hypothetical protein IQ22_02802 [Pseudomonas duriflava]|uniref:Glycoside hydrolase family 5 domain-containing protein n=1 Tax=Pseudomonas duriflava TaxID=459528 RepID=A0A562Q884_9PSED|nr:cellulase family glycosylhydrolase [Pseudomonas duriflava]TWI52967.1 hypothetical protein IQ22_02802 [Pseudomonas duriflava]
MAGITVPTVDQFNELEKRVETLESAIKAASTSAPSPAVETPASAPVEAPKPIETPTVEATTLSLVPNAQVTTGDWKDGVWVADDTARISVISNAALAIGQTATLPDGTTRTIKNLEGFSEKTSVTFDGAKLDPSKVAGKAVVFTVPKLEGATTAPAANDSSVKNTVGKIYINLGMGAGADQVIPGTSGTNYELPSEAEIKRAKEHGFDEFRIGFIMGRVFKSANSTEMYKGNDTKGRPYTSDRMLQVGKLCKKYGATIMWDNHVYAYFPSNGASGKSKFGSSGYTAEMYANHWYALIQHLKSDPDTWAATTRFDLCNEPYDCDEATMIKMYQAVINRCAEISEDKIFVLNGTKYSSTRNWVANNPNFHTITHPRGKQYIEFSGHLYLDAGADGYYEGDVISASEGVTFETVGTKRIEGFANWLKTHGFNGNIGENLVTGSLTNLMKGERQLLKYCVENGINVYLFGMGDWFGKGNAHNIELNASNSSIDNSAMLALAKEMTAYAKTKG